MRLRKLVIENFRGIKSLKWEIPDSPKLFALIGPGDSGKSTVLTAIDYLLGDRWNIPFSDKDFFAANIENEICIQAYLTEIPEELLKDSSLGLYLCGTTPDFRFCADPIEGFEPSLAVQLRVNKSLEPEWSVIKNGRESKLSSAQRRKFGVFSVDPRSDAQLRWSRTSALGKLAANSNAEREVLAEANRAAQEAISSGENQDLEILTKKVQEAINSIGSGGFEQIGAGLDTSRNAMGASLALYEKDLPLSTYGLGSKRLASLAVQQLYAGERSIALIDEMEMGLEPHRSISLIHAFQQDDRYAQVFITTHSPTVVEQVDIDSLTVVRNEKGAVSITSMGEPNNRFAQIRRGRPSSLLAKRILLCEGKTEYGIVKNLIETWDCERFIQKKTVSAGLGFIHSDASGGSEVALRALELDSLGYEVAGFMDHDETDTEKAVTNAKRKGIQIFRWQPSFNTETQICKDLSFSQLEAFATMHISKNRHRNSRIQEINAALRGDTDDSIHSLEATDWENDHVDIHHLRRAIGEAAHRHDWYKDIEKGEALGKWLWENRKHAAFSDVWSVLNQLRLFVYGEEAIDSVGGA